jgi:hypothetical protein
MPKRIANGLTLLSAVVCVGSALLVGRSWFRFDSVIVPIGGENVFWAATCQGQMLLSHFQDPAASLEHISDELPPRDEVDRLWRDLRGVRWAGIGWGSYKGEKVLILPLWLLPLLTAIPPVRWYRARRRAGGRGFAVEGAASGRVGR